MDWPALISEIGGGLAAVVIVVSGALNWWLIKQVFSMFEKRIEREREHSAELAKATEPVSAVIRYLEGQK